MSHESTWAAATAEAQKSAKKLIEEGGWADCHICVSVFRRRTFTQRYCAKCERGFCEGQHGNFSRYQGTCLYCGIPKARTVAKELGKSELSALLNGIHEQLVVQPAATLVAQAVEQYMKLPWEDKKHDLPSLIVDLLLARDGSKVAR